MSIQISHPIIDAFFQKHPNKDPVQTMVQCITFLDKMTDGNDQSSDNFSACFTSQLKTMLDNIKVIVADSVAVGNVTVSENVQNKINETQKEVVKTVDDLHKTFDAVFKISDNSSTKGSQSEVLIVKLLSEHYKEKATVVRVGQTEKESCDILLTRPGKQNIRIENKNHSRTVEKKEVVKFVNDICNRKECGLFLSQCSSIVGKENVHFDCIQNEFPVIFLSSVNHNLDKILLAIDTIDIIYGQMMVVQEKKRQFELSSGVADIRQCNEIITKDTVVRINEELSEIMRLKAKLRGTLLTHVMNSKITADAIQMHIDSLRLHSLCEFMVNAKYRQPEGSAAAAPTAASAPAKRQRVAARKIVPHDEIIIS